MQRIRDCGVLGSVSSLLFYDIYVTLPKSLGIIEEEEIDYQSSRQDGYNIKPTEITAQMGVRAHEVPLLAEELLATGGCWERESPIFFRDSAPERLPSPTPIDGPIPMHKCTQRV